MLEPEIKPGVVSFFRRIGSIYFHNILGFKGAQFINPERFTEAYQRFFKKKTRLMVAFRHSYGNEAPLMGYIIGKLLSKEASKLGISYPRESHAHFIHGYEVPLWGGAFERWLLPRVGALPVYHVKVDMTSIHRIRNLMKDGVYPIALAPEGQVSYSSDILPRIEHGSARIALWCAEDLEKEKRSEQVEILPVSIHLTWPDNAGKGLVKLVNETEKICGIISKSNLSIYQRLNNITEKFLSLLESDYSKFFGLSDKKIEQTPNERLKSLLETALFHAEKILSIRAEGDIINRVYRIRQAAWDRIFRTDIKNIKTLNPLEKALANRLTSEAWLASRYMEFVDIGFYIDFEKLKPKDPMDLYIETAQNYYDLVSRCLGGNFTNRIIIPGMTAHIVTGEPISASKYNTTNKTDRKNAISLLTNELLEGFLKCIVDFKRERK